MAALDPTRIQNDRSRTVLTPLSSTNWPMLKTDNNNSSSSNIIHTRFDPGRQRLTGNIPYEKGWVIIYCFCPNGRSESRETELTLS